MRYFLWLSYNGTRFSGWQRQPNAPSVQHTIEAGLELLLRKTTEAVGCGRTDAGVHAAQYALHFDAESPLPDNFLNKLNKLCGQDIAFSQVQAVSPEAHARFSATSRSYSYILQLRKDPFHQETSWYFTNSDRLDRDKMQAAAQSLLAYEEFSPFCKTHSGVESKRCRLSHAAWIWNEAEGQAIFQISSNRFLRGMVRLIVGECLNIGLGLTTLDELHQALTQQTPLLKAYSVPPQGLFLRDIQYPDTIFMPDLPSSPLLNP